MSFAYFIIIPFSLSFFTSLTSNTVYIDYHFTLEGYLVYILWLVFGCGLLFQLPVISIFFTHIGIFTPSFLREYRKYAIITALIIGAVLTPPDPLSQILIVIPLIVLYELSILISKNIEAIMFAGSNNEIQQSLLEPISDYLPQFEEGLPEHFAV